MQIIKDNATIVVRRIVADLYSVIREDLSVPDIDVEVVEDVDEEISGELVMCKKSIGDDEIDEYDNDHSNINIYVQNILNKANCDGDFIHTTISTLLHEMRHHYQFTNKILDTNLRFDKLSSDQLDDLIRKLEEDASNYEYRFVNQFFTRYENEGIDKLIKNGR